MGPLHNFIPCIIRSPAFLDTCCIHKAINSWHDLPHPHETNCFSTNIQESHKFAPDIIITPSLAMEPKSVFSGMQTGTIYLNCTPAYIVATSQQDGATVLDHHGAFVKKIKTGTVIQTACVGDTFAISSHTSVLKVFSLSSA